MTNDEKKMDAILAATPWRCFHCDFVTNNRAEAQSHFGDQDDAEEFTPMCKWWTSMDDTERKHAFQDLQRELTAEQDENGNLRREVEQLEYQVGGQESEIKSCKPFKDCRSIRDIFNVYDSMEGKYLAAKERENVLIEAVNNARFKVMLEEAC
jgi:hypothetical protein